MKVVSDACLLFLPSTFWPVVEQHSFFPWDAAVRRHLLRTRDSMCWQLALVLNFTTSSTVKCGFLFHINLPSVWFPAIPATKQTNKQKTSGDRNTDFYINLCEVRVGKPENEEGQGRIGRWSSTRSHGQMWHPLFTGILVDAKIFNSLQNSLQCQCLLKESFLQRNPASFQVFQTFSSIPPLCNPQSASIFVFVNSSIPLPNTICEFLWME